MCLFSKKQASSHLCISALIQYHLYKSLSIETLIEQGRYFHHSLRVPCIVALVVYFYCIKLHKKAYLKNQISFYTILCHLSSFALCYAPPIPHICISKLSSAFSCSASLHQLFLLLNMLIRVFILLFPAFS